MRTKIEVAKEMAGNLQSFIAKTYRGLGPTQKFMICGIAVILYFIF